MGSYALYPYSAFKQLLFGSAAGTAGVYDEDGVFTASVGRVCNRQVAKMVCVTFTVCYLAFCNNLITPERVS
jgi:hypothetical protein